MEKGNGKKKGKLRRFLSLKNEHGEWKWGRIIIGIALLWILLMVFFFTMLYSVGVGEAALIVDPFSGNKISQPITGPMVGIKMPWQSAVIVYVSTDYLGMWGDGTDQYADFPAVACFSKDQLEMKIDVMVRWQLDVSKLKQLYERYPGLNWKDTTIASIIREQMRIITSTEFSAIRTIEQRDIVRNRMAEAIWEKLNAEPSLQGAIINFEFELRNIGYPEAYTKAIEAKLAAEQDKLRAEQEAQTIIILKQAEADALRIWAQAEADVKVIDAAGIQEAINNLVANTTMTDAEYNDFLELYITLKALQNMAEQQGVRFFINWENGIPVLVPAE